MWRTRVWIRHTWWPVGVLEVEGVAHAQRLPVHAEDPVTLVVLDPVVLADRDQLLPQLVAACRRAPVPQSHHVPLVARLVGSSLARRRPGHLVRLG